MGSDNSKLIQQHGGSREIFKNRRGRNAILVDNNNKLDHEGKIKRNMDEEQLASGMPTQHQSLMDKMDSHRSGTLFKYAVITNKPSDERQGMLSRLRSYRPPTQQRSLSLNDIPPVRLIGESTVMTLSSVMSKETLQGKEDFVLIDCILIHFVPLDSFANDKSIVTIQLNDFRKTSNTVARTAKVDNTMGYNILFFLDYCVEKKDVGLMSLSFSCSTKEFQHGVSWGTVKVVAQLQLLTMPKRLPLLDTMGVVLLSDTDLNMFEADPREIDLVLTPAALQALRDSNLRGEIENKTVPQSDKKELMTARTVLGGDYEESDVSSVFSNMKLLGGLKERQERARKENARRLASLREEVSHVIHPSTVPIVDVPEIKFTDTTSDHGKLESLTEVNEQESASQVGDSGSDILKQVEELEIPKITRFAD